MTSLLQFTPAQPPSTAWRGERTIRSLRLVLLGVLLLLCVACSRSYRAGDEVMVEWEGKEYQAVILSTDGPTKFKVHYDGYDDTWDEVVVRSRIKSFRRGDEPRPEPPSKVRQKAALAAQTNTYRLGDHVRVEWAGRYYPAQIVDVVGKERYRVKYDNYGDEWNENVSLSRIQPR